MTTIYLNQLGIISPLGNTVGETKRRMLERVESGVAPTDLKARTGLSTPPGSTSTARAKSRWDFVVRGIGV